MNKILVKLYVPAIENEYDVWIPLNRKVHNITRLLVKAVNEFTGGYYNPKEMPRLFDKFTALQYDFDLTIKEANMKNGTEIIMI